MNWLESDHAGWRRAWDAIKAKYGDYACLNPENGEVWQYMGSNGAFHTFRHRWLPAQVWIDRGLPHPDVKTGYTYEKVAVEPGDFLPVRHATEEEWAWT